MKKLIKLFCSFGVCFSLVACSNSKVDDAAIQAFIDATVKLSEMESASYEINLNADEGTFKIYGDMISKDDKMEIALVADITSQEQTMEKFFEYYVTGDMAYISIMGMKEKQSVHEELATVDTITSLPLDSILTVDMIKPYLSKATKDGDTIHFILDMDKIAEVEGAKEAMQQYTFGEISIEIQITDGFLSTLKVNGDVTENAEAKTMTIDLNMTLKNINGVNSISFPDFSDYALAKE